MESLMLAALLSQPLYSAPDNPICKEVWEILWEYQQYTDLTDAQIRVLAGNCVDWAENQESSLEGNSDK